MEQQGEKTAKKALHKVGLVVSEKMDKTVVVAVQRLVAHGQYEKRVRLTKRFLAHDEHNRCHVGDKVMIVETRPLSKKKRWRVSEVLTSTGGEAEQAPAS